MTQLPLGAVYTPPNATGVFLSRSGQKLMYGSQQIKLYGSTIYLAANGGSSTWRTTDFATTGVLDTILTEAQKGGLNLIRVTDYFDSTATYDEPQVWKNLDYLMTQAQKRGLWVLMDLSAYKVILTAASLDPFTASNWTTFIAAVGAHYINAPNICWFSIIGEPATPATAGDVTTLVSFYTSVLTNMKAAAPYHMASTGGFNNMPNGYQTPPWWQNLYSIAQNDVCAYKVYSTNDQSYISTIGPYCTSINKPVANVEFGAEQEQGDGSFATITPNTLGAGITSGNSVSSISLGSALTQTVIVGTIVKVSDGTHTNWWVCSVQANSGATSITVTAHNATATFASGAGTAVTTVGFADSSHSLADTVANFYKGVYSAANVLKWGSGSNTVSTVASPGGDSISTCCYVFWNLANNSGATAFDIWDTLMPSTWAVITGQSLVQATHTAFLNLGGPYTAQYAFRVRDTNRNLLGEIDQYEKATLLLIKNGVGLWQLQLDINHPLAASLATPGYGIVVTRTILADSGAVVTSYVVLSGPTWNAVINKKNQTVIVGGYTDDLWLAVRDAWPVPTATSAANFASSAYDTRTGAAESVILAYIAANCISNAGRAVAGLTTAADQARGNTVTGNARFDLMVTKDGTGLLQTLAQAGAVGFTVKQDTLSTNLIASVYIPRDQTSVAKFSDALGNLDDYTYSYAGPDFMSGGNVVVVGGGGVGTSRTFDIETDSASVASWGRAEGFVDARDTTDPTTLQQRGQAALAQLKAQTAVSITIGANASAVYGLDYDLGDKVTAVIFNQTIQDYIQSVQIDLTPTEAETITPQIGTPAAPDPRSVFGALARNIQAAAANLAKLQRAQ